MQKLKIEISQHGYERLRERLNVRGKKNSELTCRRSITKGKDLNSLDPDMEKDILRYIKSEKYIGYKKNRVNGYKVNKRAEIDFRVYLDNLFLYSKVGKRTFKLVTVFPIPEDVINESKRIEWKMKEIKNLDQLIEFLENPKLDKYLDHRMQLHENLKHHRNNYVPSERMLFKDNLKRSLDQLDDYFSYKRDPERFMYRYLNEFYFIKTNIRNITTGEVKIYNQEFNRINLLLCQRRRMKAIYRLYKTIRRDIIVKKAGKNNGK